MEEKERIRILAKKYLDRTLNAEEAEVFFRWLDQVKHPDRADEVFEEEWLHGNRPYTIDEVTWDHIQKLSKTVPEKKKSPVVSMLFVKWVAAASVILAVALIAWMRIGQPEMMVYETGYGETLPIELNDGTRVILNANSRLIWNDEWKDEENGRYAELTGEAYFKVARINTSDNTPGGRLPFVVRTADLSVNVLGTSFNVSSRRGQTDVFLEEGSVKLDLMKNSGHQMTEQKNRTVASKSVQTMVMKPGELVSFSAHSGQLTKDTSMVFRERIDWKEGTLTFTKTKFGEVLSDLEDIYGKRFIIHDTELEERIVSLNLPYENWMIVQSLIEVTLDLEMAENDRNDEIRIKKRSGK